MNIQDQIEYAYDVVLKARNIEAFIEVRILDEHPDWEQYIIPLEDEWLECQDILLSDFIGENDVRTSEDFDDWFADKLYYQLLKPWTKLVNYRQTLLKNKRWMKSILSRKCGTG